MVILDKMILTRRFEEFVNELVKIRNEEMIDQARWDVWLHRVFDMGFGEYLDLLNNKAPINEDIPDDSILEATVNESWGIINGFCPS